MESIQAITKLHHLTHQILNQLGNDKPSEDQTALFESLMRRNLINYELIFHESLTSREVSCLLLAAKGKTMGETAGLLNVKYSTVETWYKNIKRKLDCRSIAQAVFEGIRFGYLPAKEELSDAHSDRHCNSSSS